MALISGSILVLMWILGHDFSGQYNRLALIFMDIISGVYCILNLFLSLTEFFFLFVNTNKESYWRVRYAPCPRNLRSGGGTS